jgi:hypothetical protein
MRLLFEYGATCLKTCKIIYFRRLSFPKIPSGLGVRVGRQNHRMIGTDAGGPALARSHVFLQARNTPQRQDCLAGHVRFELRNVVANYPFESSRGFPGSEPNSGHGDHSRLSCSAGLAARGWVLPGSSASVLHGRWPSFGVAEKARIGRDLFRSEDDPPAAKPATPLLSLRWTFRAKGACVVITDAEPDRLAPLTPPAPIGLRGVWVVAARCCASPPARVRRRS